MPERFVLIWKYNVLPNRNCISGVLSEALMQIRSNNHSFTNPAQYFFPSFSHSN